MSFTMNKISVQKASRPIKYFRRHRKHRSTFGDMAGRGKSATLPAWMTRGEGFSNSAPKESSLPPAEVGQFEDAGSRRDSQRDNYEGGSGRSHRSGGDDSHSRSRRKHSHRDRERGYDDDEEYGGRRGGGRDRSRERRSRSGRRESSHRRRRDYSRSRSRSRSRDEERRERRRRKKSNFDVKPDGVTDEAAATSLAAQFLLAQDPKMLAMQAMASGGGDPNTMAKFMTQMGMGAAGMTQMQSMGAGMQQTRHARRIYVGGVGEGMGEQDLQAFFNDTIERATSKPGQPPNTDQVISVYINRERNFGFVELKSVELATACMQLDGITFKGQPLKIRRPNDYNPALVPPHGEIPTLNMSVLGVVSTTVPDGPNKLFVGGLPYHLAEGQVRELLEAFGPLKAFHLVRDTAAATSKGYGFCEYADPAVTDKAVEGLNDLSLGEKTLTVRRAMSVENARSHVAAAGSVNTALSLGLGPDAAGASAMDGAAAAAAMMGMGGPAAALAPTEPPSRVVCLLNMVTEEELKDDQEFEEIMEDVWAECGKQGSISSVVIPRPTQNMGGVGKVFVEYGAVESAVKARAALSGRQFAGRGVVVTFIPESDFAARQFS